MQASFKSLVSLVFGQRVCATETSQAVGAPQLLPAHVYQFVGGGVAAPKSGWSVGAPKSGWSVAAPKSGW